MHLWPTVKLRETFTVDYLKNLEWNLARMKAQKKLQQQQSQKKLLNDEEQTAAEDGDVPNTANSQCPSKTLLVFKHVLMIFTCCFCCGACVDEEER